MAYQKAPNKKPQSAAAQRGLRVLLTESDTNKQNKLLQYLLCGKLPSSSARTEGEAND
jgi:hypothetical protein